MTRHLVRGNTNPSMPSAPRGPRRTGAATWQAGCSSAVVKKTTDQPNDVTKTRSEFYNEQKWCEHCKQYVKFLMSVNHSFCVDCGNRVRLFSRLDSEQFQGHVQRHKWQAS